MILNLSTVTLLAIDGVHPWKTREAMEFSTRFVEFGAVVLHEQINPSQEKRHHPLCPWVNLPWQYEWSVLTETPKIFDTSFCLFMEWDSAILNQRSWDASFFDYDFIGAPWPRHSDPGWPACTEENNVGNGGFCLKSKRFCEAVAELAEQHKDDPQVISSDRFMCRTIRPELERRGLRFAPASVAHRFSCENRIYAGEFGFHGKHTALMNGWGDHLFGSIRP